MWRVLGSGGFVHTIRASENTWGELRGSQTHSMESFPSDLLRNGDGGFLAETHGKQCVSLLCYQLSRKRGKSVICESGATFPERMESVYLSGGNFLMEWVEHIRT